MHAYIHLYIYSETNGNSINIVINDSSILSVFFQVRNYNLCLHCVCIFTYNTLHRMDFFMVVSHSFKVLKYSGL